MTLKVALIGSAPSSITLGPYSDPSWQIWACSPGAYGVAGRMDAFFELHRWKPPTAGKPGTGDPWFSVEYIHWLQEHPCVWVADPAALPELKHGHMLPHKELVSKYGPYFFTSSLAWMHAMAIEAGATTIGYWGVDMAATEEYGYQRAGCQFFTMLARAKGIEVIVPEESDLLIPPPLYGVCELDHAWIKMQARRKELTARMNMIVQQDTQVKQEFFFVRGALDDMDYMQQTWAGDKGVPDMPIPALAELNVGIGSGLLDEPKPLDFHGAMATLGPLPARETPDSEDVTTRVPKRRKNGDARRGRV